LLERFVERFTDTFYLDLARARITELKKQIAVQILSSSLECRRPSSQSDRVFMTYKFTGNLKTFAYEEFITDKQKPKEKPTRKIISTTYSLLEAVDSSWRSIRVKCREGKKCLSVTVIGLGEFSFGSEGLILCDENTAQEAKLAIDTLIKLND